MKLTNFSLGTNQVTSAALKQQLEKSITVKEHRASSKYGKLHLVKKYSRGGSPRTGLTDPRSMPEIVRPWEHKLPKKKGNGSSSVNKEIAREVEAENFVKESLSKRMSVFTIVKLMKRKYGFDSDTAHQIYYRVHDSRPSRAEDENEDETSHKNPAEEYRKQRLSEGAGKYGIKKWEHEKMRINTMDVDALRRRIYKCSPPKLERFIDALEDEENEIYHTIAAEARRHLRFIAKAIEDGLADDAIEALSKSLEKAMCGEEIEKSHVKQHTRRSKSGKLANVREHEDKRKSRTDLVKKLVPSVTDNSFSTIVKEVIPDFIGEALSHANIEKKITSSLRKNGFSNNLKAANVWSNAGRIFITLKIGKKHLKYEFAPAKFTKIVDVHSNQMSRAPF